MPVGPHDQQIKRGDEPDRPWPQHHGRLPRLDVALGQAEHSLALGAAALAVPGSAGAAEGQGSGALVARARATADRLGLSTARG